MYIVASCGFCLPSCCNMFCTPVQIHLILQPRFQRILLNKACIIVKYFFRWGAEHIVTTWYYILEEAIFKHKDLLGLVEQLVKDTPPIM